MNILTSEALGTLRADMRRVETTLSARLEARLAASESLVREELRQLREEMAQFREEMGQRLRQIRDDVRRPSDVVIDRRRDETPVGVER